MELVRGMIGRWGAARAGALAGVGIGLVVLLIAVSRWATAPAWVPLVQGQSLETVGAVTPRLDEARIPYRLSYGGAVVEVAERDVARARVLLAQQGLPAEGSPGFELFDKPSWGMTEFTQRINYRRALEGELERSIAEMQGVAGARVHLALSERSSLRREQPEQAASVVLKLEPGARSGEELVASISSLVAGSVGGLQSDHVTVLDDTGRLLNAAIEKGVTDGARKRELALRRDIEGYLEQRAEELAAQVVGAGNVRVRVATEVSFERVDRTVQLVDPDQQVTTHEEKTEVAAAAGQAGPATSATTASYEASRRTETSSSPGGDIRRMTVAVVVNTSALADGVDAGGVEALVANAVGFNRARGDSISVVVLPFPAVPGLPVAEPQGVGLMEWVELLRRPVLGVLALLLTFGLATQVLRVVRTALRPAAPVQLPAAHGPLAALPADVTAPVFAAAQQQAPLVQSSLNPELASRVLRAWAREGQ